MLPLGEGPTDDVCAICMDVFSSTQPCTRLPGCAHPYHLECLLQHAQYDVRCPVCRRIPEGVQRRSHDSDERMADQEAHVQTVVDLYRIEWRRFTQRRRRIIRNNATIARAWKALKETRATQTTETRAVQKLYDERCRSIWKYDPDVVLGRRRLALLRRRERRLESLIESEVGRPPIVLARVFEQSPEWE